MSARLGLAGIPSISESTLIARDAAIAGYEDGRIHIQHLSARESVEAVAEAKARGVRITARPARTTSRSPTPTCSRPRSTRG